MDRIIDFFKSMSLYNKEYFDYLSINTKIIDKPYSEIKEFVGCYKVKNGCKLLLPKIKSIFDELIYVHEYSHALFLDDNTEIFPNIMEMLYINKYIEDEDVKRKIISKVNKKML